MIDHKGIIRKRFAGPINDMVWKKEFLPLIEVIVAEMAQGAS